MQNKPQSAGPHAQPGGLGYLFPDQTILNRVERNLCRVGQIISRVLPDGSHEIPAIILLHQPI